MRPRFLNINGVTRSIVGWSQQPGAVGKSTISWRLKFYGCPPEKAVFTPVVRQVSMPRVRLVGVNRLTRSNGARLKRPPVRLAPAPHRPNPHPPTWGGFASYPIEALPLLRRVA